MTIEEVYEYLDGLPKNFVFSPEDDPTKLICSINKMKITFDEAVDYVEIEVSLEVGKVCNVAASCSTLVRINLADIKDFKHLEQITYELKD